MFKEIYIKRLEMTGFKGFRERTVIEFAKEGKTIIEAENYRGKTSIGEAIAWGFLGSNLWGNDKADSELLNDKSKSMSVAIDFVADGEEHCLTRIRQGRSTSIMLDNYTIKQNELSTKVGSKDIFLSVFNAEYFNSMSDKDGRDFLISVLEKISIEDITEKLDGTTLSFVKPEIRMVHADPNNYMKQKRVEIKELEKDITFAEGKMSELRDVPSNSNEKRDYDTSRIKELEEKLESLVAGIKPDEELIRKVEALKEEKKKREIELSVLNNQRVENTEQLQSLRDTLLSISNDKIEIKDTDKEQIILLRSKLNELREKYKKEKAMPLEKGEKCPTCKTVISDSHITILHEEMELKLHELKEEGNATAKKLSELEESAEKTVKELTKVREDKRVQLREKYDSIKAELEKEKAEKIEALNKGIMEANHKLLELEKDFNEMARVETEKIKEQREDIKAELLKLNKEKAEIDAHNMEIRLMEEKRIANQSKYESLVKEIEDSTKNIALKKSQIDATKEYTNIKAKLLSELIHKNLTDVKIELQKVVKSTGELKDCFEIRYKGRGMKVLSTSEKIRTGLEISNLIINQLGLRYPIFVDNGESITHYNAPDVQIIETKVVEGKELDVTLDKIAV